MVQKTRKEQLSICIGVVGALFTMGMSIWSFIQALNSYNKLNEIKGDYEVHIEHWNAQPLLDVKLIGPDSSCPSGYEAGQVSTDRNALQTIGQFPGSKWWCDCTDDGYVWTYTYYQYRCDCGCCGKSYNGTTYYTTSWGSGHCSDDARSAGCYTDSQQATATEIWYTDEGSCHTNASLAGCTTDQPLQSVALETWKNHRLCFKRGGWTAIERVEHLNVKNGQCTSGVTCQQADDTQDPSMTVCAKTEAECPIIGLANITEILDNHYNDPEPTMTHSTSLPASAGDNLLPVVEIVTSIQSPCWKGSFGQPGRSNNPRVANKYDSACSYDDTRFIQWDQVSEVTLYNENNIGTTGYNWMSGETPNGNTVSEYSDIQYYNTSTDVDWRLSYRRQIFWSSTCPSGDISDLAGHLRPLRKVVEYQYALLVINGIFGLGILGIILPILMLLHAFDKDNDLPCIPGEGETERKNMNIIQKTLSLTSKVAKMIPLILCLVVTDNIHWFFTTAGEGNCSDDVTNDAMQNLGEQVDEVKNSNWTNLYVDIAMICWLFVPLTIFIYKKFFKKPESPKTEQPFEQPNQPQPVQIQQQTVLQPVQQPVYVSPPMQPGVQMQQPVMVVQQPQPVIIQQVPVQQPVIVQPQYSYQTPEDQAAAKIQAVWRGQQVRKNMKQEDPNAQFYY